MKIVWSDLAKSNLKNIYSYYTEVANESISKSLINRILQQSRVLEHQPEIGQVEENPAVINKGFRYLIEGNYKIVYKIFEDNNEILIATVFDTRQNPKRMDI